MAKRVERWQASDGQVFESKELAELHEAEDEMKTGVERMVKAEFGTATIFEMSPSTITEFILGRWNVLYAMFDKKAKANAQFTL